jgi:MFS family permease
VRKLFKKRTTVLIIAGIIGVLLLLGLGFTTNFWIALAILIVWGVASSIDDPIRRAYLNELIPSKQRATVLSFESLMGNVGGIGIQPALGRVADLSGYAFSLAIGGVISAVAVPFMLLSRKQNAPADTATGEEEEAPEPAT